ncbi:hypothetical protein GGS21DRAFT_487595 [Xylaria nigripes]|nr:hypothetical protein GGS21DRAFT_487595 [Xylaria nigripes]
MSNLTQPPGREPDKGSMTPTPFPHPNFDFGGTADITIAENEDLRRRVLTAMPKWRLPTSWATHATTSKYRRLMTSNRLRQSETHLEDVTEPKDFWLEVLKIAPPRTWLDGALVLRYLAQCRPMDKPSNNKLWARAREWLDKAVERGSQGEWRDYMVIDMPVAPPEMWEAVRIVGDVRGGGGFGTFPGPIRERLVAAGMEWILTDPALRRIPECWVAWARTHGIDHPRPAPTTTTPEPKIDAAGDARDPTMPELTKPHKTLAALREKEVPLLNPQLNAIATQRPPGMASDAARWQWVEEGLASLSDHQTQMRDELIRVTQSFVARTLKDAIVEGPILGLVQESASQTMTEAASVMTELAADMRRRDRTLRREAEEREDRTRKLVNATVATALKGLEETVNSQANQLRGQEEKLEVLTVQVRALKRRLRVDGNTGSEQHAQDEAQVDLAGTEIAADKAVEDAGTRTDEVEAPKGAVAFLPMPWS